MCEKIEIFKKYTAISNFFSSFQLKNIFPHFRLSLPPKKWFGDNFDRNFLEDRMLGLQAFLNNITSHRDVVDRLVHTHTKYQHFTCKMRVDFGGGRGVTRKKKKFETTN